MVKKENFNQISYDTDLWSRKFVLDSCHWTPFNLRHSVAEVLEVYVIKLSKCESKDSVNWRIHWLGIWPLLFWLETWLNVTSALFIQRTSMNDILKVYVSKLNAEWPNYREIILRIRNSVGKRAKDREHTKNYTAPSEYE